MPTRRFLFGCCACATMGYANAALPNTLMNSRRFIVVPEAHDGAVYLKGYKQTLQLGVRRWSQIRELSF
jgi:hypothetical protein